MCTEKLSPPPKRSHLIIRKSTSLENENLVSCGFSFVVDLIEWFMDPTAGLGL